MSDYKETVIRYINYVRSALDGLEAGLDNYDYEEESLYTMFEFLLRAERDVFSLRQLPGDYLGEGE